MRVSIRFDLPDESDEHRAALQGLDLRAAVEEFDTHLREKIRDADEDDCEIYDAIHDTLHELLDGYGISLY